MSVATPCLHLLAAPHLRRGEQRLDLPDTLPGYLLAYLALRADWMQRDALATLCWPDAALADAQHNLSVNLNRLRPLLQSWGLTEALQAERRRLRVVLATDVARLRAARAAADWIAAAGLPTAGFLGGLGFRAFPSLEEWAHNERTVVHGEWRDALLQAAPLAAPALRLELASRFLAVEPLDEAVAWLQIEALRALDRGDDAHRAAATHADRLRTELDDAAARRFDGEVRARLGRGGGPAVASTPARWLQPRRLVGRDDLIARIDDRAARVVLLAGEAGVGKTRLLEERWSGAAWLRCRSDATGVALAPVAEYLEDQAAALPPLRGRALALARLVPALAPREQVADADEPVPDALLAQLAADLVSSLGRDVVVDDLQWADALTCRFALLLARRPGIRLALAYRPLTQNPHAGALLAALRERPDTRALDVTPLDEPAMRELLKSLDEDAADVAGAAAWLQRRSQGNPFFALQLLRARFEEGELGTGAGGWTAALVRWVDQQGHVELPLKLTELVRQRLEPLSDAARRLLGAAAVAGRFSPLSALAEAAGLSPWVAADALAEASRLDLVAGERFTHQLVRECIVATLTPPLRRLIHQEVALRFRASMAAEERAGHAWAAGDAALALAATLEAFELARTRGLHGTALPLLEAALARVDATGAAALLAAVSLLKLELGDLDGAATSARAVLLEPAEPAARVRALVVLGRHASLSGDLGSARRWADEAALVLVDDLDLLALQDDLEMADGHAAGRLEVLRTRLRTLRRAPAGGGLIETLTSLGAVHDELGQPELGYPLHEEALALARRMNARGAQVIVALNMAWCCSALEGRRDEGIAIAEEALALGEYDSTPTLRNNLAWLYRDIGRREEALALYRQLAHGDDPTLACIAQAICVQLMAEVGAPAAEVEAALERAIDGIGATDRYLAHVSVIIAAMHHGSAVQRARALPYLRLGETLDPSLQHRLDAALATGRSAPERR